MFHRPRISWYFCFCAVFSFFVALLIPHSAWSQATVNESLETVTLYVDASHGSDSNSGTKLQPLQTLSKAASRAISNNEQGVGTKIIVNPGTYREVITLNQGYRGTTLPITVQAATTGNAIISGADVWSGWAQSGSLYSHSWPYRWGYCAAQPAPAPTQQNILLRQENIHLNGALLTQVLSKEAMQPGTFFVSESSGMVYILPPTGMNMSSATVEVATRPTLLSDHNESNVVLRGLTFQYANSCRGMAAVNFYGAKNVLIDSDSFIHNNAVGLAFSNGQNFTVQSSTANHNGQKGFATHQVKYGSWQSDIANYNNWRGAQAALYTYDAGSVRLFLDHNSTFNNLTTLFNQTQGMHFDTDNENISITSFLASNNLYGLLLEKSQGPITVSNSYICGSNLLNQSNVGGLDLRGASKVTLTGSTLFGNLINQISVNGVLGGFPITNWETGQTYNLINEQLTLSKNTIATNSNTARTVYDSYLNGSEWTNFTSTLSSDSNTWSAGTNTAPFMLPTPKKGSLTSFSGWQSLTLQDTHSVFGATISRPAQCNVQPDAPDYWLVTGYDLVPVTASSSGQAAFTVNTVALGGLKGTVNLTIDGLSAIAGATASFSPAAITTSGTSVVTVSTKTTTPPGTYPVTVIANSGNLTRTVTISIVVPKTSVRLSTTALVFAGQKVGSTSAAQKITMTNTGTTALSISSIVGSKNFAATNTCGTKLLAGAACTISVTYSPTYIGTPLGALTITDADLTSPQIVSLSGTGLPK